MLYSASPHETYLAQPSWAKRVSGYLCLSVPQLTGLYFSKRMSAVISKEKSGKISGLAEVPLD